MTSRLIFVGLALVAVQVVTTQQITHTENLENCLTGDGESVGDSCGRFLASYRYSLDLPEMMGGARLTYTPAEGVDAFDVEYPKVQEEGERHTIYSDFIYLHFNSILLLIIISNKLLIVV